MSLRSRVNSRVAKIIGRTRARQPKGTDSPLQVRAKSVLPEKRRVADLDIAGAREPSNDACAESPLEAEATFPEENESGNYAHRQEISKSPHSHSIVTSSTLESEFYYRADTGADTRGRVLHVKTERQKKGQTGREVLMYLIAADTARYHLSNRFRDDFSYEPRLEHTRYGETLRISWPNGVPQAASELLELLTRRIALPLDGLGSLNLAIALDRYKIAERGVPPSQWSNTRIGADISYLKYHRPPARRFEQEQEFAPLVEELAEVLVKHPAYAEAPTLVGVPGSQGGGESLSEALAERLALRTGKNLAIAYCPPHPPWKGSNPPSLSGKVSIESKINGPSVVIDDVVRTGHSLNETALAARRAGATHVYGLVAAKTMRS